MGQLSREQLQQAFDEHSAAIDACAGTADWSGFAARFTEDAIYTDPGVGHMQGRAAIEQWLSWALAPFPGSAMRFTTDWHLIDEERDRVVASLANVMRDPGDGTVMSASNISIITFGPDGLATAQEDIFDPRSMLGLIDDWGRAAHGLGTLTEEEIAWYQAARPGALDGEPARDGDQDPSAEATAPDAGSYG